MPGILGKIYSSSLPDPTELATARSLLKYYDWYIDSDIWTDGGFACTHTGTGILETEKYPVTQEGIFAWIDGESYNSNEIAAKLGFKTTSFADLLCTAWKQNRLEKVLSLIDGIFAAVLFDKNKQQSCLITDRYGSRPFYLWQRGLDIAWSSEVKGFFALNDFDKKIDAEAVPCLIQFGHLLGQQTWFKEVRLMPSASIIFVDIAKPSSFSEIRYWKWSNVPMQKASFEEAISETVNLLHRAVLKRMFTPKRLGLLLSGGMDSRTILACLPAGSKMPLLTFGAHQSDDVRLSQQVAKRKNMENHIFPLSQENWWAKRPIATWQTDGMVSSFHLHNTNSHSAMKKYADILFNGYCGDVNLGGLFIRNYNSRVDGKYAQHYFHEWAGLTDYKDSYFDINHQTPFYLEAHIRHKSIYGGVNFSKTIEMRRPFIDNDLVDFIYGLPDEYRMNYRLYLHVVMRLSPELFGEIPWQKTGLPLKYTNLNQWFLKLKIKEIRNRLGIQRASFPIADYANWIRQPDAAKYFTGLLNPATALYPQFIKEDFIKKYLQPHLDRKGNFIEKIGRAATMEWWLQRVFTRS